MYKVETPTQKTIDALVTDFELPIEQTVKTLIVRASKSCESDFVALIIRGDHSLNEVKAENHVKVASPLTFATENEIKKLMGAGPGSLGPVNCPAPVIADLQAAVCSDFAAGANQEGWHYFGINWGRDCSEPETADLRNAEEGDPAPDGSGTYLIRRGIEVGHVFQLGQKYSEAMNATVLDENGKQSTMFMGCYGIGVTRIVAAAIEQRHDERGICWPPSLAPYDVCIVPIGGNKNPAVDEQALRIQKELQSHGLDVLLDDRNMGPGPRFADMDLIGIPVRIVVSAKTLEDSEVELKQRTEDEASRVPLEDVVDIVITLEWLKS